MPPTKLATNTREVITGEAAQAAILKGVELAFEVAKAAYGPTSGNVLLEAQYGDPQPSHDGVFNLEHLHVSDAAVNTAIRVLVQASRSTNVHVGDGTTAAAILAASVYKEARALHASTGEPRMSIARKIYRTAAEVIDIIDTIKIKATPELLQNVAIISASDEGMGQLISDTVQEIGADGGVIVENFGGAGIYNDIVSGFYFRRGFTNAALTKDPSNLESRFNSVFVMVSEKQLSTIDDMAVILDRCIDRGVKELVIIGDVQTEALGQAVKSRIEGSIMVTIVDAPEYGDLRTLFMDDVALYTGAKVLNGGANASDFTTDMLGTAKVIVNEFSTTLIRLEDEEYGKPLAGEMLEEGQAPTLVDGLPVRISQLTEELRVAKSPIEQEAVRGRLGRLTGRIAILRVGGNTDAEQREVKLRVEDAVAALQGAIKDGVVPGGGVTLARLPDTIAFKKAFETPLRTLLENAGRNVEWGLHEVKSAKDWYGYDLRTPGVANDKDKLVNLKTAGVVDPTMVIKEVVNNGFSVAAELIKTTVLMPFDNREAKRG